MGVTVADYDNDGWPDFLVTGLTRNYLFHNEGDGTFRETARSAGVARQGVWSTGAAFGDLDGDGLLDLYISSYVSLDLRHLPAKGSGINCLYKGAGVFCGPRGMPPGRGALFRNLGAGRFEDITRASGIGTVPALYSLQPLIADFDGDGRPDIFVANDSTPNYLFRNEGELRFQEIGLMSGVGVNGDGRAQASMGADLGDYDGDGRLDLMVTTFSEDTKSLFRNTGSGTFEDASWFSKMGAPSWLFLSWGVKFFDFDNDGALDLIVANGHVYPEADHFAGGSTYRERLLLFRNRGNGTFDEIGGRDAVLSVAGTERGLAIGDIDNNGTLDILVNRQDAAPLLLRNDRGAGHWAAVALSGRHSNRDGVGAVVTVKAGARCWTAVRLAGDSYLSSSDPRLHFGLGSATVLDSITVKWPSGIVQTTGSHRAGATIRVEEPDK
jgi:hypothetical protein